jgi:hypothetical protein
MAIPDYARRKLCTDGGALIIVSARGLRFVRWPKR